MNEDINLLCEYLERVVKQPLNKESLVFKDNDMNRLYQYVKKMVDILNINYQITEYISEGKLDSQIDIGNVYSGPLMELQSILKHMIWQLSLVAEGQLDSQIHFLGDFSKTFNKMIVQLKEREQALIENAELLERLNNQQIQMLVLEFQNQADKYIQLVDSMEELRRFRHDMKNHFICIDSLLLDSNVDEARAYIHTITDMVASPLILETNGNYIFNALVDEKLKLIAKLGAKIDKFISIDRKLIINDVDICIIFGNALDNCIDALSQVTSGEKELSFTVLLSGSTLSVELINTLVIPVAKKEGVIITSKSEKQKHGVGLKNIEATVEKYNGQMSIESDDQKFKLILVLCGV